MRNGHLKVLPRLPAGGESLIYRSCFCFQREKGKKRIFLETCPPKLWENSRSKSEFDLRIQIFQILKLENCKAGKSVKEKICPKMISRGKISQIFQVGKKILKKTHQTYKLLKYTCKNNLSKVMYY